MAELVPEAWSLSFSRVKIDRRFLLMRTEKHLEKGLLMEAAKPTLLQAHPVDVFEPLLKEIQTTEARRGNKMEQSPKLPGNKP